MQHMESYIGIFWFYESSLICKKLLLGESQKDSLGIYDSPFQHIKEWESKRIYLPHHRDLFDTEYQELPRGRIVYSSIKNTFIVYCDKTCLTKNIKNLIIKDFGLPSKNTLFKSDPHYQTFKYC